MIPVLKPYPAMKDSGVLWLGKVPKHWEMERAKWLFRKMDRPVRDDDAVVTCFRDGIVTLRKNRRVRGFTESLKEIGYQGIRCGDLVIHAMDAFAGAIGVADSDGKGTPVYLVCEPAPGVNAHYYAYTVREMARSQWIQALAKGIRERSTDFRFDGFGSQTVPLPPLPEQTAIVRFLDHADRRIRRYIRAKQKLVKLLEEEKQAIIHLAVTRGLDPNVRLKQLGSAPGFQVNATWQVARLCQISHIRSEKNRPDFDLLSVFLGRGVIPYSEGGGQVHKPSLDLAGYQVVYPCDLVLNNQQAWRGSVGVSKYGGIISPAYIVMGLTDAFDSRFADYLFQSRVMVSQFVTASKGVGDIQRDIHTPWLKNTRVPIPLLEEQQAVAAHLDNELADIARQLSVCEREIALLREYRTRLIADVVTGKLDVREAAARLPDEPAEEEPLDETEALEEGGVDSEGADLEDAPEEAEA